GLSHALSGRKLSVDNSLEVLEKKGILTPNIEESMTDIQRAPTFGELYMLLAKMYEVLLR
ncbi:MAG: hypothetical protein CVU87_01220, partial [Firmicutes bacterium HGW-Firmicutes-12]